MREGNYEHESWRDIQQKADLFFAHFDGLLLQNSEGKNISLKVKKPLGSDIAPIWFIELEGYQGAEITFMLDYDKKRLTIENFVNFEDHPDLKSKGIYSQIRRLIGKHFPEGFEYCIDVRNERTKNQLFAARKKHKRKFLPSTKTVAGKEILDNYWIQEEIKSGFNNIKVVFSGNDKVFILEKKGHYQFMFDVEFD